MLLLTLTLGTLKESGSIVVSVSLNAFANSTFFTSHWHFGRNARDWCSVSFFIVEHWNKCGASFDTSYVNMVLLPCNLHKYYDAILLEKLQLFIFLNS